MERYFPEGTYCASQYGRPTATESPPLRNLSNRSILDTVGRCRLCIIVWRATPLLLRLIAFPYCMVVYRRLFAASDTLRYLHAMHAMEYESSWLFRLLRPRYRKVERLLGRYVQ